MEPLWSRAAQLPATRRKRDRVENGLEAVTPGVQYCAGIGNRKVHHLRRR
jgi:hypothetical protein